MKLPIILEAYFRAKNAHDIPAMTACFAKIAGNFDDSPIELRFCFILEDGKITRLAIR